MPPRTNIMIISLDQNVVSFLETSTKVNPAWSKIKSLLIAGVNAGKCVCPIPHETAWESVPLSDDHYQRVKELQTDLSLGLSFKSYVHLLCEETLALVRPQIDLNPIQTGNWHDLCDYVRKTAPRNALQEVKEVVTQKMAIAPINYETKELPPIELEKVVHKKASFDLYRNLDLLKMGQPLAPTCVYIAEVCGFLKENNLSHDEIDRLKQLVLQHKFRTIPIHTYYNRLVTQFEFDLLHGGRRQEANDIDDLTRAAIALWGAQVYICDAEMAEMCKKAKIAEIQAAPVTVFSTRQPDMILQHLELELQINSDSCAITRSQPA